MSDADFGFHVIVGVSWLSTHNHVRTTGNPESVSPGPDLIPYPPKGFPFVIHPVGAKTHVRHVKFQGQPGFSLPGTPSSYCYEHSKSPGLVTGKQFSCLFSSCAHCALSPFERVIPKLYLGSLLRYPGKTHNPLPTGQAGGVVSSRDHNLGRLSPGTSGEANPPKRHLWVYNVGILWHGNHAFLQNNTNPSTHSELVFRDTRVMKDSGLWSSPPSLYECA